MSSLATATDNGHGEKKKRKVAVIGAGAAGLATAKQFMDHPDRFDVTILEQQPYLGGVWKYDSEKRGPSSHKSTNPMYRGLRTNLPCELMAFRDFPWTSKEDSSSYVTHTQVLQYLQHYAHHFQISPRISHSCQVTQLTLLDHDDQHVQVELKWTDSTSTDNSMKALFDVVCVCNGHYDVPSRPFIPGLEHESKKKDIRIMHSMDYDDPKDFENQVVLCIGGRASGADLAREISQHATKVYLSDTSCKAQTHLSDDSNVVLLPRTISADENNNQIHFQDGTIINDVTVIIYCTGYDYQFPFINQHSNVHDFQALPGERRVMPLYEQLWHAKHPNSLSFVGLPHSVVPFPFFEFQAQAIVSELLSNDQNTKLPPLQERINQAQHDANAGGPKSTRVQDTHFLGDFQWDACRQYAKLAGIYDQKVEDYIATNKAIYDHSGKQRKATLPGGPDTYRYNKYVRKDEQQSFDVILIDSHNL